MRGGRRKQEVLEERRISGEREEGQTKEGGRKRGTEREVEADLNLSGGPLRA